MTVPLNLDEEVRLYTTNAEREKYGLLATLFGIIVALDYLERAYVRDSVTAVEYVHVFAASGLVAELVRWRGILRRVHDFCPSTRQCSNSLGMMYRR